MAISLEDLHVAADRAAMGNRKLHLRRLEGQARLICATAVGRALHDRKIDLTESGIAHSVLPSKTGLSPTRILAIAQSLGEDPVSMSDVLLLVDALDCKLSISVSPKN